MDKETPKYYFKKGLNKSVAIILFTGLILRILHLNTHEFFTDEAFQLAMSQQSWSTILFGAVDVHPPLSYVFTKIWVILTPVHSVEILRILLVIIGVINIYLVYVYANFLFDREDVAVMSSYLYAISSTHIFYSAQFRMYELAISFLLLSFIYFESTVNEVRSKGIIFQILAHYTHYFTVVGALLQNTWLFIHKRWGNWKKHTISIGLASLPLIFLAMNQLKKLGGTTWTQEKTLSDIISALYFQFFYVKIDYATTTATIMVTITILTIAILIFWQNWKEGQVRKITFFYATSIIIIFGQYFFTGIYHHRYVILLSFFPIILLAKAISNPNWKTGFKTSIRFIVIIIFLFNLIWLNNHPYNNIRATCQVIDQNTYIVVHPTLFTYLPCKHMYAKNTEQYFYAPDQQSTYKYGGSILEQQEFIDQYPSLYYYITTDEQLNGQLISDINGVQVWLIEGNKK